MKIVFFIAMLFYTEFSSGQNVYSINVDRINGTTVNLSSFSNKKIVIAVVDVFQADTTFLKMLNSLQVQDSTIQLIISPATDWGTKGSVINVDTIKKVLSSNVVILSPAPVTKAADSNQLSLLKWLTEVGQNRHFDVDVQSPGQLFVVNRKGILYGVFLNNSGSEKVLTQTLQRDITQDN